MIRYGTVVPWNQSLTFSAVQYSAATGVFAMWFGLLQLLRCFENYGATLLTPAILHAPTKRYLTGAGAEGVSGELRYDDVQGGCAGG